MVASRRRRRLISADKSGIVSSALAELGHDRGRGVVAVGYLLKIGVGVGAVGRVDHLLRVWASFQPWPVRAWMMLVTVVRISGATLLDAR